MFISLKFSEKSIMSDFTLKINSFCMYYDTLTFIDCNDKIHQFDYDDILSFSIFSSSDPFLIESK